MTVGSPDPRADSSSVPVAQALARATTNLHDAGIDSARADAEWLLIHLIGGHRGTLAIAEDLSAATAERYSTYIDRRAAREPLQHITGTAPFGALELLVGAGVFVPRPETEWLLEWALKRVSALPAAPHVVDLCSGSGALAIAIAVTCPDARVDAVEKSAAARTWLQRNIEHHGVTGRVRVIDGDVTDLGSLADVGVGTVDLLVTNPPYVPETAPVSPEVAADPPTAVFGGTDGLAVIRPMVAVMSALLATDAPVAIEHDESSAADVVDLLQNSGGFTHIESHRDLTGRLRFTSAVGT